MSLSRRKFMKGAALVGGAAFTAFVTSAFTKPDYEIATATAPQSAYAAPSFQVVDPIPDFLSQFFEGSTTSMQLKGSPTYIQSKGVSFEYSSVIQSGGTTPQTTTSQITNFETATSNQTLNYSSPRVQLQTVNSIDDVISGVRTQQPNSEVWYRLSGRNTVYRGIRGQTDATSFMKPQTDSVGNVVKANGEIVRVKVESSTDYYDIQEITRISNNYGDTIEQGRGLEKGPEITLQKVRDIFNKPTDMGGGTGSAGGAPLGQADYKNGADHFGLDGYAGQIRYDPTTGVVFSGSGELIPVQPGNAVLLQSYDETWTLISAAQNGSKYTVNATATSPEKVLAYNRERWVFFAGKELIQSDVFFENGQWKPVQPTTQTAEQMLSGRLQSRAKVSPAFADKLAMLAFRTEEYVKTYPMEQQYNGLHAYSGMVGIPFVPAGLGGLSVPSAAYIGGFKLQLSPVIVP